MIQVHVTIYQSKEGDRFKVHSLDADGVMQEVTDDYDVYPMQTEEGRCGFAVLPILSAFHEASQHPRPDKGVD